VGAGGSVQRGMEFEDFDQLKLQIYLGQVILQPGHANTQILLIPGISSDKLPDLHSGVVDWWILCGEQLTVCRLKWLEVSHS
jgi:hypothetical protein